MFAVTEQPLPGVFILNIPRFNDHRGVFLKTFSEDIFVSLGIEFQVCEQFITCSHLNVLRGMHYQAAEAAHMKLVSCPIGRILDVIVDIRPGSQRFNQPFAIELGANRPQAMLIGKGYAHGFLTLEDQSWVHYLTSSVHSPSLDKGVHWASINFDWPFQTPIMSDRDRTFPSILALN